MRNISLLLSLTLSIPAFSKAYQIVGPGHEDKETYEITNFPNIRTQDGVGICYAASATQLLNYEYCKQNNLDCSQEENQLSLLDVTARYEYFTKSIKEGGNQVTLLKNLKPQTKNLYKEQCLPFELLAHKNAKNDETAQGEAYRELTKIFNLHPRYLPEDQKLCHAKVIKDMLPIEKDLVEIMNAYHSNTIAQFVYQVAVKDECSDKGTKIEIPSYNTHTFPTHRNKEGVDANTLLKKVEKLVLNDIPVSLSFCAANYYRKDNPETCGAHAATIVGVKETCLKGQCKILLKVHNSYGQSWQDRNNDGWVEAIPLMQRSLDFTDTQLLTWVSEHKDEKEIPEKSLARTSPKKKEKTESNTFNKWGGPTSKEAKEEFPMNIDHSRGPIFSCDENYFGEWRPDRNCKFMMYTK